MTERSKYLTTQADEFLSLSADLLEDGREEDAYRIGKLAMEFYKKAADLRKAGK